MECTDSLFADIPTSERMSVFWFSSPLMEMVRCRLIASTAISEQSLLGSHSLFGGRIAVYWPYAAPAIYLDLIVFFSGG